MFNSIFSESFKLPWLITSALILNSPQLQSNTGVFNIDWGPSHRFSRFSKCSRSLGNPDGYCFWSWNKSNSCFTTPKFGVQAAVLISLSMCFEVCCLKRRWQIFNMSLCKDKLGPFTKILVFKFRGEKILKAQGSKKTSIYIKHMLEKKIIFLVP